MEKEEEDIGGEKTRGKEGGGVFMLKTPSTVDDNPSIPFQCLLLPVFAGVCWSAS